jgi:hypothetical protein
MQSEMVRWGGLAGVVAGVMFLLSGILTFIVARRRRRGLSVPLAPTCSRSS